MIGSKFHRESQVKGTTVSQASRKDAQPVSGMRFETYREEYDYYVAKKTRVEEDLQNYNSAAFSSAQAKIRKQFKGRDGASIAAWMEKKIAMDNERKALVRQKNEYETEIIRLRPLVKEENRRYSREDDKEKDSTKRAIWEEILKELREIKTLLSKQNK
jgi:hypothetical protein